MAKCNSCGRKGIFFKVNSKGLCKDCEALAEIDDKKQKIEQEIVDLSQKLSDLNNQYSAEKERLAEVQNNISNQTKALNQLNTKREEIYNIIKGQAEIAAITNIKDQIDDLNKKQKEEEINLKKTETQFETLKIKFVTTKTLYESYQNATKRFLKNGESYLDEKFIQNLSPTIEIELQCFSVRQLRKLYSKNQDLIQDCFKRYEGRYTTKTNSALYRLMTIALKAELQNILFNIKIGKLDESIESIKVMCEKYLNIAADGNQSIAPTMKKFIGEVEVLFIDAIKIEYEYYVQRERIKEEQRAIREQMRQEVEERKALERERKHIEQEEQKYRNEIENIRVQLENAESDKAAVLNERIAELENQINAVEEKREQILSLENGKAGYVYIISNIGSFGENIYKIGMTRRMEPMERINELGNASVPFPFDVHGLIFSDDAVSLEHELHTAFNNFRVNKVNLRKEFFKVQLDDIEKAVGERFPSAEFRKTALAEQYYQSLTMLEAAEELSEEDLTEKV